MAEAARARRRWGAPLAAVAACVALAAAVGVVATDGDVSELQGPASAPDTTPEASASDETAANGTAANAAPLAVPVEARDHRVLVDCVGDPPLPTVVPVPGPPPCARTVGERLWRTDQGTVVRGAGPQVQLLLPREAADRWNAGAAGRAVAVLVDDRRHAVVALDGKAPHAGADGAITLPLLSALAADEVYTALTGRSPQVAVTPLEPPVEIRAVGPGGCVPTIPPDCDLGPRILLVEEIRSPRDLTPDPHVAVPEQRPQRILELAPDDASTWGRWTSENVGSRVAVVVEGDVLSAPVVQGPITSGVLTVPLPPS